MFMTKIIPAKSNRNYVPTNVATTATNNIQIRRTTSQYGPLGTWHSNRGYMKVGRDAETGRFVTATGV